MIDFKKPVQTRSGSPVTILTKEARGKYPLIGHIGESKTLSRWDKNGKLYAGDDQERDADLINVPEKRTAYVNIVKGAKRLKLYRTSQEAASAFDQDGPLIARVKIEYTEGQRDE